VQIIADLKNAISLLDGIVEGLSGDKISDGFLADLRKAQGNMSNASGLYTAIVSARKAVIKAEQKRIAAEKKAAEAALKAAAKVASAFKQSK